MLTFYKELSKHSPPESAHWPLPEQRKAWDDVCRAFRAKRPDRLMVEDLDVGGIHVRVFRPPGEELGYPLAEEVRQCPDPPVHGLG